MTDVDDQLNSAKAAEAEKDWSAAADHYRQVANAQPENPNWHYRLGLSLERARRFDESIIAYQSALGLDSREAWWLRLGASAEKAKREDLAKDAYSASLALKPSASDVEMQLLSSTPRFFPFRQKIAAFISPRLEEIKIRVASRGDRRQQGPPKIFLYWDTGFDHAPAVVKACHRELMRFHSGAEIVALDAQSWPFYVEIPEHVTEKIPSNKAHFSDVLRVALLARYGGIWADATCMPSRNLTSTFGELSRSGFFSYHYSTARISNWFLCSSGDNYIAKILFEVLIEYWREHDTAIHYFMFHHIFEVLYHLDSQFQEIWDRSTKLSSTPPHLIQRMMFKEYDPRNFEDKYRGSAVHKLTYKFKERIPTPAHTVSHIVRGDF